MWNLGLIFQWGTHLIPARGPISWRDAAYNQVAVVPVEATRTLEAYLTRRKQLMHRIEQQDVDHLKSAESTVPLLPDERRHSQSTSRAPLPVPVMRIVPSSRWWVIPFTELWDFRELIYFFVWRDIKIRYKQTAVGAAWAVLQPFLMMLVFSLFFGKLANIGSDGLPYPIFYYSALLPWMYFAAALQNSTNTIVENQRLITKVYFPRLALPLSSVLSGLARLRRLVSDVRGIDDLLRHSSHGCVALVSGILVAGSSFGIRYGVVAFRHECDLSRRQIRFAVSSSVLAVRLSCRVSQFPGAAEMALALRIESDGRSDRGVSLVADRPR